jgi:hypothetical protein
VNKAFGVYRAELALRFLGLEAYPRYRAGGRLENYRGPLSDEGLRILGDLAFRTAHNLESFSEGASDRMSDLAGGAEVTFALAGLTLEELASSEMRQRVEARLH